MDCRESTTHLLDYQRGRLGPEQDEDLRTHLAGCPSCSRSEAIERTLTDLLERRLPQHPAPIALKLRLAAQWPSPSAAKLSWWERWGRSWAPAGAVALLLLVTVPVYYHALSSRQAGGAARMVTEAVNDHLRILQSQHPLEVESGNFHQVKPWFAGKLDFAPAVRFLGDPEFPLKGGSVGYFLDRKAAIFTYGYRLHVISLLVFRAESLPWPAGATGEPGKVRADERTARGFNVILWRDGELGYALVSDADMPGIRRLAAKLGASS
ncbi:MAG: zf-HC2 domain-containing protein [Deltaproteobacteria bacterium]|nr:zf-HC2 domain-containing protein [Candidatus Deferrimicrobiaceae bacterium]